jgi:hypothetical protein
MKKLIDIIDTTNEPNIIEQIMAKEKPKQKPAGLFVVDKKQ